MGKGVLELQLVDAKGLQNTDLIAGKVDPYVVIQYRGQEHKSKIARGQGSNPTWNETFRFLVRSPAAAAADHQNQQHKVTLRVMDHDTFTADDFLGEATIYVGDVIARGVEEGAAELQTTKYRVVLADRRYGGEIRASVTFTNKETEEEETGEEFGGWKHSFRS
ncbi:elicitor-responsive protein 1-like isoform X1 [Zingiber officinale]|uniref:elicitor-responsive protein 1-like isoform X1 n=1 Tax=Zingiber officinale TaxID=94328 RepID=UPI001C4BD38E|nr:elicitor-responsive protein 1-like isoform X1 [Zingiber officinale]